MRCEDREAEQQGDEVGERAKRFAPTGLVSLAKVADLG